MLNPSSRCNRKALSFSASVNRRAQFAPRATLGGLFLFFSTPTSSFMLTLHLSFECQPLSCLSQSHALVVRTPVNELVRARNDWDCPGKSAPKIFYCGVRIRFYPDG